MSTTASEFLKWCEVFDVQFGPGSGVIYPIAMGLGGTGANLTASNGGIVYSAASAFAVLAGTPTPNLPLLSGASGEPSWAAFSLNLGGALTSAGALDFIGAFGFTATLTNTTSVTFPTSGTLATTAQLPTPSALSATNDTNVTASLGGSPTTALLQAVSITLGWTGTLSPTRGGSGVNNGSNTLTLGGSLTTSGAFASTFTMTAATSVTFPTSGTLATVGNTVSSGTGTANQILVNGTTGTPTTGALTFTLPQNIATTSNVVFNKLTTNSIAFQANGQTILASDGANTIAILISGGTSVNYMGVVGAPTGANPQLFMTGSDANVGLQVSCQAAGVFAVKSSSNSPFSILSGTSSQHTTTFTFANTANSQTVTFPDTTGTVLFAAGSGGLKSFTVLTTGTGATYTTPAGITSILVEVVGGGGGGGGASTASGVVLAVAGGGAAGGYSRLWVASAAASYTYTVGAAGTAGVNTGGTGGTGGTTTFSASSLQATGGTGGLGSTGNSVSTAGTADGGVGGVGSNGDINVLGEPGRVGASILGVALPGGGGGSHYGGGGSSSSISLGAGVVGGKYGSGGSGAIAANTSSIGGAGSAGLIVVWEYA